MDELISDVLRWTPTYGRVKAGRPARTYIQQLYEDTWCSPEDLPEEMNDREMWRERVRDIHASGTTWWWWWWVECRCIVFPLFFWTSYLGIWVCSREKNHFRICHFRLWLFEYTCLYQWLECYVCECIGERNVCSKRRLLHTGVNVALHPFSWILFMRFKYFKAREVRSIRTPSMAAVREYF